MTSPTVSQAAECLDLKWVEGDALSLQFTVEAVDWSGAYVSQVRRTYKSATIDLTFTVLAVLNGADTDFTLTASAVDSASVLAGQYVWDLQTAAGLTRLTGKVTVDPQVTQ